jgi:uncharacterized protein YbaR (Trm112 family)
VFAAGTLLAAMREVGRLHRTASAHRPAPPKRGRGIVVDVGGGQCPHPRADVVVEKYLVDDFERPGGSSFSFATPLVVGDGHSLPLAAGSAAYVIASHVLEHATEPDVFAAELARVAPAGFVQVPSRESELTYGWAFHPWLIDLVDGVLVFEARTPADRAPVGRTHHEFYAESALLRLAFESQRATWHHSVEWRGSLQVQVHGSSRAERSAELDLEATVAALEAADVPPLPDAVKAALACPSCRSQIVLGESATCIGCGSDYPVVNGVPILLVEAALTTAVDEQPGILVPA